MFDLHELNTIKGKIVVVTGSTSGIGFQIAKTLSAKRAKIIIAGRNEKEGIAVQRLIKGDSEFFILDLANFESVQQFAKNVRQKFSTIDLLVNNAGVMRPPFSETDNKLELTFGINYIGYYLLTNMMLPMMKEVEGSRIVNMSSIAQYQINQIDWGNVNSRVNYRKSEVYALSNLFRMMFTLELEKKLRIRNYKTIALACHPGVSITKLTRYMPKIIRHSVLEKFLNTTIFHTPYQAAMPALMAATSKHVQGGDFVGLDGRWQFKGKPKVVQPNPLVFNVSMREKLWNLSVEITGVELE